jgi:hypothetical protein
MQSRLEGIYEEARDVARALAKTEAFERILRLGLAACDCADRDRLVIGNALRCCLRISSARCSVRVHAGGDRLEPAQVG